MLTVLTQMPAFVSGNRSEGYGHLDGPTLMVARLVFSRLPRSTAARAWTCGGVAQHLACSAAANPPTRIIFAACSRGRWGNEAAWWKEAGIDPVAVASKLWDRTREAEGRTRADARDGLSRSDQDGMSQPDAGKSTRITMLPICSSSDGECRSIAHVERHTAYANLTIQ